MTDYATYKALPAQERDELGFAQWRSHQRVITHGPGCHTWGAGHYDCAVRENAALAAEVERLRKDAGRRYGPVPLDLVVAINEATGSNEWQGEAGPDALLVPACQAVMALADKGGAPS